ncbi:MAG: ABC transporter permease [Candidatus Marinimicrobia bacterium]|nr:ABC transporter permease [Candidatus Neomarinimicrobiota bacterium]
MWSKMVAIARREWAAYFNSPVAYVFIVIFLVLTGFMTFSVARFYEAGQADLRSFFFWHPWLYLILAPAAAMRAWAEERRSGTIELLFSAGVRPWEAILGKFLASWLFLALALVLTFPMVLTVGYLGRPDYGAIAGGYLGSLLLAGAYLAAGQCTSACTRNQVVSFVLAVVLGLFLLLAGYPPVTDMLSRWAPGWLVAGVAGFSVMPPYDALQRGVIDLRDLVYFASLIGVLLFATERILAARGLGR